MDSDLYKISNYISNHKGEIKFLNELVSEINNTPPIKKRFTSRELAHRLSLCKHKFECNVEIIKPAMYKF
ncbi:hypothetical protein DRJ17_06615 [Candidatus Woesearchaeota archaeon]|nr:MAG: hypothetical protein DRJ17_06615 [Candidatus Woesearchaeota archaeon]